MIGNRWRRIGYTLIAPVYDAVAGMAKSRQLSIGLLRLEAGQRVLLVGAGTGLDLDYLPAGVAITAIDLTPAMLDRLRLRATRLGLEVDARVMDAQALEFADGSFDAVLLHFIVAVAPDPRGCVREAARVLRPGGRAMILDKFLPDEGPVPLKLRLLEPVIKAIASSVTQRLGPILEGTGLRVMRMENAGMSGLLKIVLCEKME